MSKLFYCIPYECPDSYYEFTTRWRADEVRNQHMHWVAEDAAEHHWSHHDGYETGWPAEITLHMTEGGKALGKFSVGMEMCPNFSARPAEEPDNGEMEFARPNMGGVA